MMERMCRKKKIGKDRDSLASTTVGGPDEDLSAKLYPTLVFTKREQ